MRIARMSAALGFIELFAIGAPEGYQPSTKYWRMMAAAAAAAGGEEIGPAPCMSATGARANRVPPHHAETPSEILTSRRLRRASLGGPPLRRGRHVFTGVG